MRELTNIKIHQKDLLLQEYIVDGVRIGPVITPKGESCNNCILQIKLCSERLFDDNGLIIPDCWEDYLDSIIYKQKDV